MPDNFRLPTDGISPQLADISRSGKPLPKSLNQNGPVSIRAIGRTIWILLPIPLLLWGTYYTFDSIQVRKALEKSQEQNRAFLEGKVAAAFRDVERELASTKTQNSGKDREIYEYAQRSRQLELDVENLQKNVRSLEKDIRAEKRKYEELQAAQSQSQLQCRDQLQKKEDLFKSVLENERRALNERSQYEGKFIDLQSKVNQCGISLQSLQEAKKSCTTQLEIERKETAQNVNNIIKSYRTRLERLCKDWPPGVRKHDSCAEFR